jgi:hypothetical protein
MRVLRLRGGDDARRVACVGLVLGMLCALGSGVMGLDYRRPEIVTPAEW